MNSIKSSEKKLIDSFLRELESVPILFFIYLFISFVRLFLRSCCLLIYVRFLLWHGHAYLPCTRSRRRSRNRRIRSYQPTSVRRLPCSPATHKKHITPRCKRGRWLCVCIRRRIKAQISIANRSPGLPHFTNTGNWLLTAETGGTRLWLN